MIRAVVILTAFAGALIGVYTADFMVLATPKKRAVPSQVVRRLPKATATLSLGDTVVIGGITYTVQATLVPNSNSTPIPTPIPAPIPTPTPTPTPNPIPVPPPGYIDSWRNSRRDYTLTATEGETVYMDGRGFGMVPGKVIFDQVIPVKVLAWSDAEIALVLPHVAGTPHVPYVQVFGPDGTLRAFLSAGALTINPRPLPAGQRPR